MAGGKGTRISSVASDIPKLMIKIEGKLILEHELACLEQQWNPSVFILNTFFEKASLGNVDALFKIKDKLDSDFLLPNADAVFDVDFNRFVASHN